MKLKYIFASIVATLALAVSCEKEADHYLNEIKVSASYVPLSTGVGANNSITVTATDAWSITVPKEANWLTVSPTSGNAGETVVTFTAPAYDGGRTAEIAITSGSKTQYVNIIQGVKTVSEVTCDEVMKNPGKTYRVTGTVTRIANTVYGNWNMDDGTHDYSGATADNKAGLYIYGTLDNKGNTKNFSYWGLEVGDKITVEGPSKEYNGTIELVDVTVIKIVKSLIKVDEVVYPNPEHLLPAPEYLPVAGGEAEVTLVNKGESLKVVIPEDAKSWLFISGVNGDKVTLKALPNEGGDRETTVTFGTNQGNEAYTCELAITQKGAIKEITVDEFNKLPDGTALYRLKGVITEIKMDSKDPTKYNKYGNFYIQDGTGIAYIYGLLPEAGGASGQDVLTTKGVKVGDVITVVGPKSSHNNAPQMANAYYESHSSATAITCADFNALTDNPDKLYLLEGTVTGIVMDSKDPTKYNKYSNFYVEDKSGKVYVYGLVTGLGAKGTDILTKQGVKEGDIITVVGPKASHSGSPQMANGFFMSVKPADEGGEGEGGDTKKKVTLDGSTKVDGGNNNYNSAGEVTQDGVTWSFGGNLTTEPWRIGGKNIENTDREVFSKTKTDFDVASVSVEHGGVTVTSVNSFKLIVSTNADFSSPVSELTGTVTANQTTTFTRPTDKSWKDCYFKFVYNVTVTESSNKYVQFKKAVLSE